MVLLSREFFRFFDRVSLVVELQCVKNDFLRILGLGSFGVGEMSLALLTVVLLDPSFRCASQAGFDRLFRRTVGTFHVARLEDCD